MHWFCLGYSRLAQVNNSPRANVFPAGEANFAQAMYRSLERSAQDTRNGFDLYSVQASFACPRVDLARPLRRVEFRPFLDYILRVCQSLRDAFLQLGKLHWFLNQMLSYFYDPSTLIYRWSSNFVEKVVLERERGGQDAISWPLPGVLYCMEGVHA